MMEVVFNTFIHKIQNERTDRFC